MDSCLFSQLSKCRAFYCSLSSNRLRVTALQRTFSFNNVMTEEAKRAKPNMIGTHNGTFHCDEALACFMLKQLPEYENSEIVRTRDPARLSQCDIVVDVGGVFDPTNHRYDHHQRTFSDSMHSLDLTKRWTTKLSSAGLVYHHFGRRFISKVLGSKTGNDSASNEQDATGFTNGISKELIETVYDKVYENFMEEVDAVDNGIDVCENPRYLITTTLSNRVSYLNPAWNEKECNSEQYQDRQFEKAMALVGSELVDRIRYYGEVWWPARSLVVEALLKRVEVDASGEILILENGSFPWKDHLMTLEVEQNLQPLILFVLYADSNGMWRIQCVPRDRHSFENRLSLPEAWRGVRDEELCKVSGIEGATFVHASGFIGGNKTREGALAMARFTLKSRSA